MKKTLLTLLILSVSAVLYSQNENPFAKFGYDVLVATSSKGEFTEFHDQTDIVEIGSVLFNRHTNEIVKVLDKDSTTIDISSATAAMSIDPLCEKYYWISPYAYCYNNPIRFRDPTGKEGIKYTDKDGNKIIESNVVVLVEQKKTIPQNATSKQIAKIEKQNAKIEKRNNERVADVQQRLNDTYNGADSKGTKNAAGETIKFKFNVKGMETSDTKGGTTRQIRAIAEANALPSSQKNLAGGSISALAAVVTTRSTGGALGLSNRIFVTEANGAPSITLAHEVGHTLHLNDNFPSSTGGLMDYPPGGLISSEVDEIWNKAYEK